MSGMEATPRAFAGGIPVFCAFEELVDPVGLVPNPRNPYIHPEHQIQLLARLIKAHGWRAPITVSNRSGFVVRGHCRLAAALVLGAEAVPIDRQDYENEAKEWADLVADNRVAELAERDGDKLQELLREITEAQGDVELTGYTVEEVDALLAEVIPPEPKEFDEDTARGVKTVTCPECGYEFPL